MHVDPWSAALITVMAALVATMIGFPIAIGLGWMLARKDFYGKSALGAFLLLPLALPPVVVGLMLLRSFGRSSTLGGVLRKLGVEVPFTFVGIVLASLIIGLPLYVMATRDAIRSVDRRYEEVAQAFGHRPLRAFFSVTFPQALPGICGGAVLAFARALGEFGATAIVSGNIEGRTRTLSLAIYSLLDAPGREADVVHLTMISGALALLSILAYEALARWQAARMTRNDAR